MAIFASIIVYAAIALFGIAILLRILMWTRLPMHVRWELYPVAHEGKRAHYGGSYLEEVDWWKKPREVSLWGELKVMVPEILFLVALKENNPKLWWRSFPFHFGLYLFIGSIALMIGNGVLTAWVPMWTSENLHEAIGWMIRVTAIGGLCLGVLGALGLLQRRLTDNELKDFTAPADILNLVFFVIAFGAALVHVVWIDADMHRIMRFVQGIVAFQPVPFEGGIQEVAMSNAAVVLLCALLVYIPLTHMSHFVGKFFAYHSIRWNDTPNLRGGNQEKEIHKVLSYPVGWSAPHIKADGKKTWVDVATEEQKQ